MVMMLCGFGAAAVSRFVPYSCVVVSLIYIYIFYLTYNISSSQKPQTILRWQFRMGRERFGCCCPCHDVLLYYFAICHLFPISCAKTNLFFPLSCPYIYIYPQQKVHYNYAIKCTAEANRYYIELQLKSSIYPLAKLTRASGFFLLVWLFLIKNFVFRVPGPPFLFIYF